MGDPKAIRRDQLAKFIPDNETILRFQRLFQVAGEITPAVIEEIEINSETNSALAISSEARIIEANQNLLIMIAALDARINTLAAQLPQLDECKLDRPPVHHRMPELDYIDFNLFLNRVDKAGRVIWDSDDGTLNCGLYNDVILQMGQEMHYYAKNNYTATVNNGQPVRYDGTIGASGKLKFTLAQSSSSIPAEYFMGIATQDIAKNNFGYITHFGLVRGIDTTGTSSGEVWNDGDILYLSTTTGQLTLTAPTAPNPKIMVASVVYSHATTGSLFVRPRWGNYLGLLHDVYFAALADNDLITYDAANSRWVNTADPVVDTISINDNAIFSGTSGEGNQVDIATPTFPWQDMLGQIVIRGVAATDPNYTTYQGNLRQYKFSVGDFVEISFHVLHDYVPSTDMYIHTHWSHNSAAVTSGSVTWSFEIWYAKGHDQAPFPASKTITVTQNGSTTQYQHMIAEVAFTNDGGDATHYDRADIEIDGLVIVIVSLSANTLNAATDPFLHLCDVHYQTTSIGSKNKAPNFYVT